MKRKIVAAAMLCVCLCAAHMNQKTVVADETETVSVLDRKSVV